MAAVAYAPLEQAEEDNLHASRLLNIEEKLFKRLSKRLLTPTSNHASNTVDAGREAVEEEHSKWREDAFLDFAAFESNIVRVQFLLESNARERQRYATEKLRILETAQAVRNGNAQLHDQLRTAQGTLALRKTYDELAEKITANRLLRPREEQHAQMEKLHLEIAELERESLEYAKTWGERREQFGRIVDEGMQMLRLIRDEKEEAERKEAMDTDNIDSSGTPLHQADAGTPKEVSYAQRSRAGTPGAAEISAGAEHTVDAVMTERENENTKEVDQAQEIEEGEEPDEPIQRSENMDTT